MDWHNEFRELWITQKKIPGEDVFVQHIESQIPALWSEKGKVLALEKWPCEFRELCERKGKNISQEDFVAHLLSKGLNLEYLFTNNLTKCEPINPAPPVTNMVFENSIYRVQ